MRGLTYLVVALLVGLQPLSSVVGQIRFVIMKDYCSAEHCCTLYLMVVTMFSVLILDSSLKKLKGVYMML